MSVLTIPHYDRAEGKIAIERVQDVEPILDWNKWAQNDAQNLRDFHHIGRIPNVILEKWCNDEGVNILKMPSEEFGRFIKRKLNDPDYRWLRTTSRKF